MIFLNVRLLVAGKVSTKELYAELGHTHSWVHPNSFREAFQSRVLVPLIILPKILKLIPVLYLPVE